MTLEDLRPHGLGKHLSVDHTPYGGGAGTAMRVDRPVAAIEAAEATPGARAHRVLLTPVGERLVQHHLQALARSPVLPLLWRDQGFDERVASFVDQELSLGDFVSAPRRGRHGAARVHGAAAPRRAGQRRLTPRKSRSATSMAVSEYPHRPPGRVPRAGRARVPKSGDHAKIAAWRHERALERTRARRPDWLAGSGEARGGVSLAPLAHHPCPSAGRSW